MNKTFRLVLHQKGFSDEDLIISQKDYPEACLNNILEIYHPPNPLQQADEENHQRKTECDEESHPRLLLQITSFKDDLVPGKTISVEQSIGATFGLKNYNNVSVKLVDPKEVALDSVELTFRDQYMGRSEMWRLKNNLINTCVYLNKKIEFCGRTIRCQVYEMWSQGIRVACGVINEDTHIVFRSSTAMVYIFLQMSSEMWEFDNLGDLYFEKAVNGFLSELFTKWKKNGSNHEVTIVLFSRTFYQAKSLDEFPLHMKECLQKDYKGRYYEDFYRVPVQNERYDDWSNILVQLRKIFLEYLNTVLNYHERTDIQIPIATNSTAARGNFLEVLNMSLNVFEKHYLDRSFDRTGQLSVVVTPGVGVFEVDRELTNITKQRIIDGGVGSDLVCVGEQPLHAVPLLKFHNKDTQWKVPGDYSMPHWINLSFYSTNKKLPNSDFIPRIKVPSSWLQPKKPNEENKHCNNKKKQEKISDADDCIQNAFFDFDAYDAAVFETPSARHVQDSNTLQGRGHHHHSSRHHQRSSGSLLDSQDIKGLRRKLSDPDIKQYRTDNNQRSEPIAIPSTTTNILPSPQTEDREFSPPMRMVVGSEGSPPHESKALINPFDPSHVTIKLTSNRRRWTHIFPKGPTGVLIQQHHYQAIPAQRGGGGGEAPKEQLGQIPNSYSDNDHPPLVVTTALLEYCKKRPNTHSSSTTSSSSAAAKHHSTTMKSSTFLWGATGEQEWTPALTTVNEVIIGVDWKSLTIPACLPITTDYFPDQRTLDTDYVVSLYTLVPDSVYADFAQPRGTYKKPLTTDEVFRELISQRLAQGFQLILMNKPPPQTVLGEKVTAAATNQLKKNILRKSVAENEETYNLSIGRLFHKISLSGNTISITRYRPRHPYPGFNYQYRYRFHAPYHSNYEESYATFTTEKLEHYNWNYLDHYVCTGGDTTDFVLVDALKYWRFRLYILPFNAAEKECTKKIVEGASRCDIYSAPTATDQNLMVEGFLKFIEAALNKLKRSNNAPKKTRKSISIHQTLPQLLQPRRNSICTTSQNISSSNSPFRERLGSNRLPDRPRPRSGSKVLERTRNSQGSQEQQSSGENIDAPEEGIPALVLLKPNCSSLEIIESFKHPIQGLFFINIPQSTQSFPNYTFVAADAVNWLQLHVEGVNNNERALQIMQNLHKENLIRHASGNVKQQFIYGFFLFYIVPSDNNNKNDKKPSFEDLPLLQTFGDLESFENEFFEVEIKSPLNWGLLINEKNTNTDIGVPHFLCDEIDPEYGDVDDIVYKKLRLETDVANKSERTEWGHARYQTVFRPDRAYEIVAEWLTSSGSIVGELVYGWHRKGQSCGLQLIPIPHDPLALPYSEKSDPLRGPIFVPLNIACLDKGEDYLFKDFSEDSWRARMFLLQEAIVQRFGFLKCLVELPKNSSNNPSREYQYIHGTGTIFILITNTAPPTERSRANSLKEGGSQHQHNKIPNKKYSLHADIVPSPHEAYITRHVSGKNKADYDNSRKMGFLWCWNHMISKRWRTNPAVDSNFQIKVLKDFQAFCNNSEDRLLMFWRESWNAKSEALLH